MKAKEYYNSTRMVETRNWTLDMAMNFAEEYYEERTKALTIQRVSKSFYCQQSIGIGGKQCDTQCYYCEEDKQ